MNTIDTTAIQALSNEHAPLYCRYDGATEAQPAHLSLDEDGRVSASYAADVGNAVPIDVYSRRAIWYRLPSNLSGLALANLVARPEITALLGRIHAGHTVEWDGRNNVGTLTTDAQDASDELETLLADVEGDINVWLASEWLSSDVRDSWDAELSLDAAVTEAENIARADGVYLGGDLRQALLEIALSYLRDGKPGLSSTHLAALREARLIGQGAADEYLEATREDEA